MLTAELVRAVVRQGVVRPRYVDPADPALQAEAARLVSIFEAHVGRRVGDLDEAIADHIGDSTAFLVQRGMAKLLMDRTEVQSQAPREPEAVREAVFRLAAAAWPVGPREDGSALADRAGVLAAAAAELDLSVAEVEAALYADLKDEERVVSVDAPEALALVHRYNLSLAQAVLLKAREVRVTLPEVGAKRARQLFRIIKFHRLMHRARRDAEGLHVTLDGPLSLFRQTSRYGLQLALFLPGLCHCERWSLEADVVWGQERRECLFQVDHEAGLVTHTRDVGAWESDEERHFRATFKAAATDWKLRRGARVVDLDGRGVLVPDYTLHHPDGRVALLEIIWFWRQQTFAKRLALLAEAGPPNLIIALATRLNTDERSPELPQGAIYPFKGVIQPKQVVALAEQLAI